MGIEKLGLPSLVIPDLFLAEKISHSPVQHMTDLLSGTPTPPTSTPPPGLVHPSCARIVRTAIIPQSLKENYFAPARRGSDPGTFNRSVIEGATSYKSAVQGKALVGGDGHAKSILGPTRASTLGASQMDNSDTAIIGANGHGCPPRRINPKIVELIESLSFAMEMKLTIDLSGCASVHCSPFGSVS